MNVLEGLSENSDARIAICEATNGWGDCAPDILFAFHSSQQDPHAISAILTERFPNAIVVGATTAGEWSSRGHHTGTLVLLAIASPNIRWAVVIAEHLDQFDVEDCSKVCDSLLDKFDISFSDLHPERHFCLSFFDGMSKCEESIVAMVAAELGNIPLLGGSAADDLKFENTFVLAQGRALQNAAVFVLAESRIPFKTIKHQHFLAGDVDTIITKANVPERIVYHLDGLPAAERYAQLLGLNVEDLNAQVFSEHPLIYQYNHECYVRAIGQLGEDNALIFYCAIEEGMILNFCARQNMLEQLKHVVDELVETSGKASLMLIFNCVLRRLESESIDITQHLAAKLNASSDHIIGFDSYGEQWQGLHVNQTMVALALYDDE